MLYLLAAERPGVLRLHHLFPVRSIPAEEPITQERRSKLQERFRVATRIAAQVVYRLRRAPFGGRVRRSSPAMSPS